MSKKIFRSGKNGITGVFRKLRKGMFRNLCFSSNIVRKMTSGRTELVRYVACVDKSEANKMIVWTGFNRLRTESDGGLS